MATCGMDINSKKAKLKRPMNAFLMFCKERRSTVRESNPHLDNRSVTRILGDLWVKLDPDSKVIYMNAAKQVGTYRLLVLGDKLIFIVVLLIHVLPECVFSSAALS
jgi:HMG (high mobility group) box